MRELSPTAPSGFAAVLQTEVLFNLKRIAPYALMVIFSANAVLWWGWGPAIAQGWAVNSDFHIMRLFRGFSFITGLPLFIAVMMGDPVIRDFRIGVDPLLFSKPVSRAGYLLGKFFGNFFVLVCCQASFALTALLLQAFSREGMIVLPPRVLPYFQHFFFFIVITSLVLGAICFTVGTLTRNVKIVYGLGIGFYFLYIPWQLTIKSLPMRWRVFLDPLLFNSALGADRRSTDWLNHAIISYDPEMIANRIIMLSVALVCLWILHRRFSSTERAVAGAVASHEQQASLLGLAPRAEGRLYHEPESAVTAHEVDEADEEEAVAAQLSLPRVERVTEGWGAKLAQFAAALWVEFRLLRAERSLVVVAPLIMLLCGVELAAFELVPEGSYSATYAGRTAESLLLFLSGVAVFYGGETMHRDRELGIEPVLWSTPAPNPVILLSKFCATLLLSLALVLLVALTAIALQVYKGHAPLELSIYLKTYALITIPNAVFMIAASVALNVLLRDKYLSYAVSLALAGVVYYFAGQGQLNWLYNPVLYRLWTPSQLALGGAFVTRILIYRLYALALSGLLLALALLFFERRMTSGWKLKGNGWALLTALVSALLVCLAVFASTIW